MVFHVELSKDQRQECRRTNEVLDRYFEEAMGL